MKRWIAVIVIAALAAGASGYVAAAPRAPYIDASWRAPLDVLDGASAELVARLGLVGAIAVPLAIGLLLALAILLVARTRRRRVAPGPVWRPEPLPEEQRIGGVHSWPSPAAEDEEPYAEEHGSPHPPRPVALVRKPRERERDWFGDASWLGGLPRLAGIPWPRDESGLPMPFAAQVDLAELAAACPESPLPREGALAFFVGDGAVVPVPPGKHEFSAPPARLPAEGGGYHGHDFFPFWPVEPVAINVPEELRDHREIGSEDAFEQAVTDRLALRYALRSGPFTVGEPAERMWWHGAIHLADEFQAALDDAPRLIALRQERADNALADLDLLEAEPSTTPLQMEAARRAFEREQAKLEAIRGQYAAFPQVVAAMDQFVDDRDPWKPLTGDEFAVLQDVLLHVHRDCGELVRHHAPTAPAQLAALSLRAMASGPPEALGQIPETELARINAGFRLPNANLHQVFGPGSRHHAASQAHRRDILLLQLAHDDMMEWNWGESGLYQFWIAPQDLAHGRWDKVVLTFETA